MKNLRVAMIGGGFMGRAHSLAYAMAPIAGELGATLEKAVLVDVDAEVARQKAAELGWAEWAVDWREIVARPDIDIVDICTPPQFHQEIAEAAIAAKKHVFCEKPITNVAADAHRMAETADAAGVVNQVGFNYRHTPAISFAKKLLDEGKLGVPLQVRASYLQEGGFTASPTRWRAQKSTGGSGTLGDIGSHIIDLSQHLLGDIVRVAARVRSKNPNPGAGWGAESDRLEGDLIDDGGVWIAEFASGAIGSFAVSSFASGRKNRLALELDASLGAIEFDWNLREQLRVSYIDEQSDHRGFRTIHMNDQHPDGWWRLAGIGTGYLDVSAIQFQKFIRAIVDGTPADPSFAVGAQVESVVEALAEAAVSDGWIDVPRSANS